MNTIDQNFLGLRDILNFTDAEELFVASRLRTVLGNGDYALLNNLLLPTKTKIKTTQIDHIVVSIYGIFCIETKSHKGWVLGSKNTGTFKQILFKNKHPIVPNPIFQNYGHVKAVEKLIGNDLKAPVYSIIVFPSADKIIVDGYDNVCTVSEMLEFILSFKKKIYRYDEAKHIAEKISSLNMRRDDDHSGHVSRVRKAFAHV